MKKILLFFSLIFLLISCSSESEEIPELRDITFSFSELNRDSLSSSNSNNLTSNSKLLSAQNSSALTSNEDPFAILITIVNSNNEIVINNQLLTLFRFGNDEFTTEAIGLEVGDYEITLFSVINSENRIIYATPVQGSLLAQLVDTPLNIPFSVTNNNTTLVTPDVITVLDTDSPEQFGFVTFSFNVVGNQTVTPTFEAGILNGSMDEFTLNTGDNVDAWDMTPNSTVVDNDDVTIDSPYRALWNNTPLNDYIDLNFGPSEQMSSTSFGINNTRGLKFNASSRRAYQPIKVEAGVKYTITLHSRAEVSNSPLAVYILNNQVTDEVNLEENSDAFTIINDHFSSSSNIFTKTDITFVASSSEVTFYAVPPVTTDSSSEIFIDDISITTFGFNSASNTVAISQPGFEDVTLPDGSISDGRDSWRTTNNWGFVFQLTSNTYEGLKAAKFPTETPSRIGYQELEVPINQSMELSFYSFFDESVIVGDTGSLTVAIVKVGTSSIEEAQLTENIIAQTTITNEGISGDYVKNSFAFNSDSATNVILIMYTNSLAEVSVDNFELTY